MTHLKNIAHPTESAWRAPLDSIVLTLITPVESSEEVPHICFSPPIPWHVHFNHSSPPMACRSVTALHQWHATQCYCTSQNPNVGSDFFCSSSPFWWHKRAAAVLGEKVPGGQAEIKACFDNLWRPFLRTQMFISPGPRLIMPDVWFQNSQRIQSSLQLADIPRCHTCGLTHQSVPCISWSKKSLSSAHLSCIFRRCL